MLRQQQAEIAELKVMLGHYEDVYEGVVTHPVKEQDESFDRTASHMAGEYVSWTSCVACGQRVTGDSIHTCSPQLKQLTDEETESFEFWSPTTGWDSIPIPANKKLSGRDLQRWRQEAWRRL